MDFTTLPIGTPVIWDSPNGPVNGVIDHISDDSPPIRVKIGEYDWKWFTSDGRFSPDDGKPSLRLADPAVNDGVSTNTISDNTLLPDHEVWLRFLTALISAEEWDYIDTLRRADQFLEEYKKRFQ